MSCDASRKWQPAQSTFLKRCGVPGDARAIALCVAAHMIDVALEDVLSAPLLRGLEAVRDSELRCAVLSARLLAREATAAAAECEALALAAERGEPRARALLPSLVAVFAGDIELTRRLRAVVMVDAHFALARLLGRERRASVAPTAKMAEVVVRGAARPLTLGERKSLARRGEWAQRLLTDPHPDVVARVLASPRITEADVVRLVAMRPGRAAILAELARSPRWLKSSRVRTALCAHPQTPPQVAAHLATLLLRQELRDVLLASTVPASVRSLCASLLARRPPLARTDVDPATEPPVKH